MWFKPKSRHITLSLRIENQWAFHIKGPADMVVEASTDWLEFVQRSTGDTNASASRNPVGFSRTRPVGLAEAQANTDRAFNDEEEDDD